MSDDTQARLDEWRRRLLEVSSLCDDWDGYGSYPPSAKVVSNCERLINLMDGHDISHIPMTLSPASNGVIVLEWGDDGGIGEAHLEIGEELIAGYVYSPDTHIQAVESVGYINRTRGVKLIRVNADEFGSDLVDELYQLLTV